MPYSEEACSPYLANAFTYLSAHLEGLPPEVWAASVMQTVMTARIQRRIDVVPAELRGRQPHQPLENAVEMGQRLESHLERDFGNADLGVGQQLLGLLHP